tara:strand:- start:4000 stop:4323 length:324 start_codon:yes stop_codon:yes gene_type:complete
MIDLQLLENQSKRVDFWEVFEKIADRNPFLYSYLKKVKETPKEYDCELCFLFKLFSEEITCRLDKKLSHFESKAVLSILWGGMKKLNRCQCEVLDTIGKYEASRKSV